MKRYAPQLILLLTFCASEAFSDEVRRIVVWSNGIDDAASVNTEKIYRQDVKRRMGDAALLLLEFKKDRVKLGKWDAAAEAEWTRWYVESYRAAMRSVIRERLMFQQFDREKMSIDPAVIKAREENADHKSTETTQIIQDDLKLDAFRRHLSDLKTSEDDWLRANYPKSLVLYTIEGNTRPLPIDFFFPNNPRAVDVRDKIAEFQAAEKTAIENTAAAAPAPPAPPLSVPALPCIPCPPCPCPPPCCPVNSRR